MQKQVIQERLTANSVVHRMLLSEDNIYFIYDTTKYCSLGLMRAFATI